MIIYTEHAKERVAERRIKKEWIERVIRHPDKLITAKYGRKQAVKKINNDKISVIYIKENSDIVIVTVHWGE